MDKTWIHNYTLKSNSELPELTAVGDVSPNYRKTQESAIKIMPSVFWNARGVLFIEYFEKSQAVNSDNYVVQLVRFQQEIGKNGSLRTKKEILTKTMYRVAGRGKGWQKCRNYIANCFRIRQI